MQPACSNLVYTIECSWSYDVSRLTVRHLSRPRWGRDDVCVAAVGGKTPDISSERRTFADVMTENKLKAKQVRWSCAPSAVSRLIIWNAWFIVIITSIPRTSGMSPCTAALGSLAASEQTNIHCRLEVCYSTVWLHTVLGLPAGSFQSFDGPYVSECMCIVCWGPTLTRWPSAWSKQR